MAEKKRVFKYTIDESMLSIAAEGMTPIVCLRKEVPETIHLRVFMHGLKQLVGDAAANEETLADKEEAMREKYAQLVAGHFRAEREGGGPKAGKTIRAVFNLGALGGASIKDGKRSKVSADVFQNFLRKALSVADGAAWELPTVRNAYAVADEAIRKTIAGSPEVKLEMARMSAEEAAESGASLLA